jgi:multidrug efflux pump subunit AcrA (membrane-fusion protein)
MADCTLYHGGLYPVRWLRIVFCLLLLATIYYQPSTIFAQEQVSGDTYLEPSVSWEGSFIETGIIETIHVKEGDYVKKTQPLISLNTDVMTAQYEAAKARAEAKGRIMAAKAERDQQSHRYDLIRGIGNEPERLKELAILQTKEGNLLAAEEEVKIARLDALRIRAELNTKVLAASIEGFVIRINKDEGEAVGPGNNDPNKPGYLIRVVKLSTLHATAFLPYKAVRNIKIGDFLTVESSDLNEPWQASGKVFYVNPIIDPATGTVEIKVQIENADMQYKSGAPAKVVVQVAGPTPTQGTTPGQ